MIYLNEWFPNPAGNDAAGEFLELFNNGPTPVSLDGWMLKTEKGKTFTLIGRSLAPRGYLVLTHADTKLTLRNSDGGLALYNAAGAVVDHGSFLGAAPEGESFSRVDYGTADIAHFAFMDPTPGAPNNTINTAVVVRGYPGGVPLNAAYAGLNRMDFLAIIVGTAALIVGLIVYIAKSHEDLSHLLFRRDEKPWRTVRARGFEEN
ncbi:MAG TPA: lamin tail domain-containing protein [Candidatus Paceibacterota bacterium]|jgi:hypothetical protein|nr:lamin tail domain-containing protein [Candidatus Paceibacterota bacterium]